MSEQCTPGPWIVSHDRGGFPRIGFGLDCVVADLYKPKFGNAEANARLIAAAPELLDFARRVAEHFDTMRRFNGQDSRSDVEIEARRLIAKATLSDPIEER